MPTPAFALPDSPFDLWSEVAVSASKGPRRLSGSSIKVYRAIWSAFERHLIEMGLKWHQATPEVAGGFLRHGIHAIGHSSRVEADAPPSVVTQKRYWRVLRDIYQVAVLHRSIADNPFDTEIATGMSEHADALVLAPHLIARLAQGLQADFSQLRGQGEQKWQACRDVAVVAFLLLSAAKTSELVAVRASDLHLHDTDARHGLRLASVTLGSASGLQPRTFIPPRTRHADALWPILDHWHTSRLKVPGCPQWLFFGQKHDNSLPNDLLQAARVKLRGPLTEKSVFLIVASAIGRHLGQEELGHGLAHRGAQVLRNSVIASWLLAGTSPDDVALFAGVKDPRAIARLDLNARS